MQKCRICGVEKLLSCFHFSNKEKNKRHTHCNSCQWTIWKKWRDAVGPGGRYPTTRKYYIKNRGAIARKKREHYKKNRAAFAEYNRKRASALKKEAIAAYGGMCACCGESKIEFLCIDHIYGGGNRERKKFGMNVRVFRSWLKKSGYPKDRYRVLCYNCNSSLGFFKYCPHQPQEQVNITPDIQ